LGLRIDATNYTDAVERICRWAKQKESRYVCAANVHMVMEAYDCESFRSVVNGADLVTPDGMPLVWMLRGLGVARAKRTYGPDLTLCLCAALAREGIPVGFFGSRPQVLTDCVQCLKHRYPSLRVVFQIAPPFRTLSMEENQAYLDQIRRSGCRVLFVGLGCPKQERWMAEHGKAIPAVMVGVGAAFDFFAGRKKQAPGWLQRLGLEWLFRWIHEPRRLFRRYVYHNPRFLVLVLLQWIRERFCGRDMESTP
jgi:N-acetylglucosaminyldiphosphoundecaprenol N-acetyl-beta-D-mannosaminyltransferase